MKIIVTGGCGFIGSAVVRRAVDEGHQVINIDSLTYAANLKNVSSVAESPYYYFRKVDICDEKIIREVIMDEKPDAVMHLAAESHVDQSIVSPKKFIQTNIVGTYNLLQASLEYWVSHKRVSSFRFLHVSTDEVFGALPIGALNRFSEASSYDPKSPYSASKAASDHLIRAWGNTYDLPVIVTNCSNNYGPYHYPEKLIPLTIIRALRGLTLDIYGDGRHVRDWLFVEDHANALLTILQEGKPGCTYCIGGENEVPNIEVVKKICKELDLMVPKKTSSYSDKIRFVKDRPGHDERYAIDCSYLKSEIGWRPQVTFDQGIKETVKWYLENESWWRNI